LAEQVIKKKGYTYRERKEARVAYLCLIPAFVGLTMLTYGPLAAVFGLGFYSWNGKTDPVFVGFDNYFRLFTTDPYLVDSIVATIYFSGIAVAGGILYSLFVAMLLTRKIPARGFLRAVFYLPYLLPGAAVYIGWSWLYETNFGLFNYLLNIIGIENVKFLSDSSMVVPSLAVISIWLSGNLIVIFMAGLNNVPQGYHEAAQIDGANSVQRFFFVTLPSMTPILFYNLLLSLIMNMQIVTPALALTSGGPGNSSMFMAYLMYRTAFTKSQIGYASAITFVFFIMIAVFTVLLFATSKKWIFYEGGDD
jgi:multiple sugar transport system permease protein